MRLIDAEALRVRLVGALGLTTIDDEWDKGLRSGLTTSIAKLDAAPTVDVPQPLTRDGVLAEVARIEAAGDTAVVEYQHPYYSDWRVATAGRGWVEGWQNPDVPRWNVRVRAVEVETETVPLTRLVGHTIKGETEAVNLPPKWFNSTKTWRWWKGTTWGAFPDGTLDLATGLVTVLKGEA